MINIILIIILSVLGGCLYRLGGSSSGNRLFRMLGVPAVMLITMTILGGWHWILIICFGLLTAALSTYFKRKNTEATWMNWLIVGIALSVAMFPALSYTHNLRAFGLRTLILTVGITSWSEAMNNPVVEEFGRGFLIIATLPILFS